MGIGEEKNYERDGKGERAAGKEIRNGAFGVQWRGLLGAIGEVLVLSLVWSVGLSVSYVFFFPIRVSLFIWAVSFFVLLPVVAVKRASGDPETL